MDCILTKSSDVAKVISREQQSKAEHGEEEKESTRGATDLRTKFLPRSSMWMEFAAL